MRHLNLNSIFCTFILFFNLVILQGCSNQEDSEKSQITNAKLKPISGGIYRVPLWKNPATLDPAYVHDTYGIGIVHQIFDGLVRFDQHLSIMPAIAKDWQIKENGKLYRFILKENARFHNLDNITAEDVVFSIKRLLRADPTPDVLPHLLKIAGAEDYRNRNIDYVKGLDIENEKILTIRLQEPHAPFLTALGMYQASIVPKKKVLKLGENFGKQPVGAGPFIFVSWKEKESVHLKRFESYYSEPSLIDGIQYKIYSSGQDPSVLADFKNGILDEMAVYGGIKKELAKTEGLQWFHRPSLSLFFYGMNVKHPNLSDPNLRKALSLAIDRQAFVNQVFDGQFDIAKTILPPGIPGYTPLNEMGDNNLNLARQYLSQSSSKQSKDMPEIEMVSVYKTPRVEQEMSMMKKFWAELGVKIKVKYITDWEKFEAYLKSDLVQIYRYAWFADMPDPDNFLYPLFASDSSTNYMKLQAKNIDQMLLSARGIVDPIKRAKLYQKIEADIMFFSPLIPLFYMSEERVYQPYVQSIDFSALGAHVMPLQKIWLDKNIYKGISPGNQ